MSTTRTEQREVLRSAFLHSRSVLLRGRADTAGQREVLIEALGDWLCGAGEPPTAEQIAALESLCEDCAHEERAHAEFIAHLITELAACPRA